MDVPESVAFAVPEKNRFHSRDAVDSLDAFSHEIEDASRPSRRHERVTFKAWHSGFSDMGAAFVDVVEGYLVARVIVGPCDPRLFHEQAEFYEEIVCVIAYRVCFVIDMVAGGDEFFILNRVDALEQLTQLDPFPVAAFFRKRMWAQTKGPESMSAWVNRVERTDVLYSNHDYLLYCRKAAI